MIMRNLKLISAILVIGLLSACENSKRYTKDTFVYEGCTISYVNEPTRANFYIARCENTSTLTQKVQSGKTSYQQPIITVEAEDLRKQLAQVEARDKALAKLSSEEKEILGVK
jgi:hypothetical protein